MIGLDSKNAIEISAKTGEGIDEVLEAIVNSLPPPKGEANKALKAMLVDSWYDKYLGVVILVRVIDGSVKKGMDIKAMSTNTEYLIKKVGIFTPKKIIVNQLNAGNIGFITGSIKQVSDYKIGDTITDVKNPCADMLPRFKPSQPMIFCGVYPADANNYPILKDSIAKLKLNDSSLQYETEISKTLGFGFRCGFLGMLHLEIIQERLKREYALNLVITVPSVIYKLHLRVWRSHGVT